MTTRTDRQNPSSYYSTLHCEQCRPERCPEFPENPEILKFVFDVLKFECCPEIRTDVLNFFFVKTCFAAMLL